MYITKIQYEHDTTSETLLKILINKTIEVELKNGVTGFVALDVIAVIETGEIQSSLLEVSTREMKLEQMVRSSAMHTMNVFRGMAEYYRSVFYLRINFLYHEMIIKKMLLY